MTEGSPQGRRFISNTKPYQTVKPSALTRWLPSAMNEGGIDATLFKAHSVRLASASSMLREGLSLK